LDFFAGLVFFTAFAAFIAALRETLLDFVAADLMVLGVISLILDIGSGRDGRTVILREV